MLATVVLGLIVYVVAIAPPSVIWQINMFAFGRFGNGVFLGAAVWFVLA